MAYIVGPPTKAEGVIPALILLIPIVAGLFLFGCRDNERWTCKQVAALYCNGENPDVGRLAKLLDEEDK